jgi:glycosyltransferase 2 family protein
METVEAIMETHSMEMKQSVARKKKLLLTMIKCGISGVLIYWILLNTNISEVFMSIRFANISLLVMAFSLNFVGCYLSSNRWRILLRAQGVDASIFFLVKSFMVGVFFNNFLPSTIGGDTIRAYDSWRVGKNKAGAAAVIFVDRFLGLFTLMIFALGALLISKKINSSIPFLYLWLFLGATGMFVGVWIIFMPSKQVSALISKIRIPFSIKLQSILEKIFGAFRVFKGRKDVLIKAFGMSLIVQTNMIIHYYLIAKALDLPVPFYSFFAIIPLAIFIMMIPVSINAIGIRENVFAFFFTTFGVSTHEAVAFAWLAYGILILQGMMGGVVYALRK